MGYRSEVVLGLPKNLLKKLNDKLDDPLHEWFSEIRNDKDYIVYHGEYLKWNTRFVEVNAIDKFLMSSHENECFLLVLGEDGVVIRDHNPDLAYDKYQLEIISKISGI